MIEKISRLIRSLTGFSLVAALLAVIIVIHIWLLFANYGGLVQSLEMLGYDQQPLSNNRLFGWIFEALSLGTATQCELYAGAIVFIMSSSLITTCYLVSQLIVHLRDRSIFLRSSDEISAENTKLNIYYNILPWLILFLPLTLIVTLWDIKLFIYRSTAGIFEFEEIGTAQSLEAFDLISQEYSNLFSIRVTKYSAWGYGAAILLTTLSLEYVLIKFRDRWNIIMDSIDNFISEEENENQSEINSDAQGTVDMKSNTEASEDTDVVPSNNGNGKHTDEEENIIDGSIIEEDSDTEEIGQTQENGRDMAEDVEIIGAANTIVRRSEAVANKDKYYVDGEGKVWDRQYYDKLHVA